jgi:hypothetical protein
MISGDVLILRLAERWVMQKGSAITLPASRPFLLTMKGAAEGQAEGAFRNQKQFDTHVCRDRESRQSDRGHRPRPLRCNPIKLARALERLANPRTN